MKGDSEQEEKPIKEGNIYFLFFIILSVALIVYLISGAKINIFSPYSVYESEYGEPGRQKSFAVFEVGVGEVIFNMRLAPGGKFPVGIEDSNTAEVKNGFWIGETEVTYELWYAIRLWAMRNGYTFLNPGREGNSGNNGDYLTERREEPVTDISWYDALVWCNALSEYLEYDPVYKYNGEVIRNAQKENAVLNAVQVNQDGFRLPTAEEWELTARYNDNGSWTPGDYASGSTGPAYPPSDSTIPDPVAWYKLNSGGRTHEVGLKDPNDLGVYDMSGNVYEWCFSESESNSEQKVVKGSCWSAYPMWLRIGFSRTFSARHNSTVIGLRLVKNLEE